MRLWVLRLALLCCGSASGAAGSQILTPEVDSFINSVLKEWNSAGGAAVAVVRRDDQGSWALETKGYGVAKADGTKVTPDTVFSIASNSKLFDIFATGLLISNQSMSPQISWTTKLASILPDWKLMDPVASSESTIIDLMSHRTGFPRHDYSYVVFNDSIPALVQRLKYLKPSMEFRETFQYSNIMYAVLSYLPTALLPHKPPFARYVKEHIIDPLELSSTTYSLAVANATGQLADGFAREGINITKNPLGAGTTRMLPYFLPDVGEDGNMFSGPSGVFTTAVDAARWLQMLLSNGQHPTTNATIIPAAVVQMVATGVSIWDGNAEAPELSAAVYGGGQVQYSYRGHVMVEHGGDIPGFHSQITRFPSDDIGVAVLTNDDAFGTLFKEVIKYRVIDEVFELDPVDWNSRYKDVAARTELAAAALTSTPAPPNASLPFPLAVVQGTYRNLGYGPDISLCVPSSAAPGCTSLIARLNSTFPAKLAAADAVWAWDRPVASYVTLAHFNGPVFNVSAWVAMPTGSASAPFWAYDSELEGNVAEFVATEGRVVGFGIRGGLWGAAAGVGDPEGTTVEARSEVWFDAVSA